MPFPTNTDTNANTAADTLVQYAKAVRAAAVAYIAQCDAGSLNAHDLIAAFAISLLSPVSTQWATLRQVSGVQAVLRSRFPSFADDAAVTTALNAVQSAIDATVTYIVANTPVDGSGYVLTLKVVAGAFQQRVTTNGTALANLKTQLVTLRDAFS